MTRDELRAAIQETVDSMRGDSMMALAATNAIMGLIDSEAIATKERHRLEALAHIGELAVAYFSPFHQRARWARKTLEAAIADYELMHKEDKA